MCACSGGAACRCLTRWSVLHRLTAVRCARPAHQCPNVVWCGCRRYGAAPFLRSWLWPHLSPRGAAAQPGWRRAACTLPLRWGTTAASQPASQPASLPASLPVCLPGAHDGALLAQRGPCCRCGCRFRWRCPAAAHPVATPSFPPRCPRPAPPRCRHAGGQPWLAPVACLGRHLSQLQAGAQDTLPPAGLACAAF